MGGITFWFQLKIKILQAVSSTSERLWNLAGETVAPVWSPSEYFLLKNFVEKSFQKKWSQNVETATPWVFDWTWRNLSSQIRPNVPSTNLWSIPPTFVWIVNFIFPGNVHGMTLEESSLNKYWIEIRLSKEIKTRIIFQTVGRPQYPNLYQQMSRVAEIW